MDIEYGPIKDIKTSKSVYNDEETEFSNVKKNDIIVTIGAGDVYLVGDKILKKIK